MKPWMWVLIIVLAVALIAYGIYAFTEKAKKEAELDAALQKQQIEQQKETDDGRTNVWQIISSIAGAIGGGMFG